MPLFYQHNINADNKIAVWHITEDEAFFLNIVPPPQGITHWHKRLQHLAGRYLLQELFPDFPYHLIEIAGTRKPYLPNDEYHFSISHCGDFAAVIVSKNKRVGIDIEQVTPKVAKIRHKFLGEEELKLVPDATPGHGGETYLRLLTLLWSCKEAVFKWDGRGGIDFKKNIQIHSRDGEDNVVNGVFLQQHATPLAIHYLFFDSLCLAWIQ